MCGITGFLTRTDCGPDAASVVTAMTRTLTHRGPDSEGIWVDRSAGMALGHRRLAIVDLSPAGNQPMVSSTGRFVIAFNGEIYNFLDLRRELQTSGGNVPPQFHGHSDTEIMLACFEHWGVADSVTRFNGMFAFALWDRVERTLYLARDRMGEKPLYYGWARNTLLFGSELKSLCAYPDFPAAVNRDILAFFLKQGYVPAPYSIYKDIFKLPPGTILSITAGSAREKLTRYWSFREVVERGCANPFDGSDLEAQHQLESLLTDAARIRMIADVPLGAFLSGGIDSSLVVALMQSLSSKPVRTFTIGFHESEYNEAVAARAVAKHLRTDHTEWYVTPSEARAVVPQLPALYDEPFADSSQIPTFLVSGLARRHVTVSLSGDGGDELFGGYQRWGRISRTWRRITRLPLALRRPLAKTLKAISRDHAGNLMYAGPADTPWRLNAYRLQKLAAVTGISDPAVFYDTHLGHWHNTPAVVRGANGPSPREAVYDEWPRCEEFVHQMMAVDTVTYLPDDILAKVDRASMGVSLESRIPLLDHRIVEFAWRLPLDAKIRAGETKWILRRILHKYVPRALVDRPKSGFAVPVAEWIRGPLREWAEELLDPKRLDREGYLVSDPIRRRWLDHLSGRHDQSEPLWAVLMFQAWLEHMSRDRVFNADYPAAIVAC
jgi:asparagine synthase (glutamine-hydrolysing)